MIHGVACSAVLDVFAPFGGKADQTPDLCLSEAAPPLPWLRRIRNNLNHLVVKNPSETRHQRVRSKDRRALGEGEDRLTFRCCSSGSEATGTTIPFIMQPARAMTAEIAKVASKPPIAAALPPISDPSAMPKNSALLFQASAVPDRSEKSRASPACWAGKNNCASAELKPSANSMKAPQSSPQP